MRHNTQELAGRITMQIEERFGCRVPVIVRTAEQIGRTVRNNPFVQLGNMRRSSTFFLASAPNS